MENRLVTDLDSNTANLRAFMNDSCDLTIKRAVLCGVEIAVVFCEGMASTDTIAELIYNPVSIFRENKNFTPQELMQKLQNEILLAGEQTDVSTLDELAQKIMSGFTGLLVDGVDICTAVGIQGYKSRGIEEPSTHANLRGSREGFVEVVRTNISMLRRRMKTPELVFEMFTLGKESNTDICLCYLKNRASAELVDGTRKKLENIPLDTILEGGYIQPFIEGKNDILFSEAGATERPDTLAAKLNEGRVGIIVDGTPFALYLPHLFVENFQTVDDYTSKPLYATIIRWLRYAAFFITILLPGFYVALANFNPELISNALLLNLASSVQSTPYPLMAECLIIHIVYEIMREAGIRLPSNVGHAVSIVGGLVIGEIVVSAGLVGAPLVLIVALSAITGFVVSDLYQSAAILRFMFIFAGGLWGLFGLTVAGFFMIVKICSVSVGGTPFTSPVAPFTPSAMRDVLIRAGWKKLSKSEFRIDKMNKK